MIITMTAYNYNITVISAILFSILTSSFTNNVPRVILIYSYFHCSRVAIAVMRATAVLLVVCLLLWSLVEVHSQTAPYVSFMGEILPNHAFVDLSLVGNANDGSDSIQCHTDLAIDE